MTHSHTLSVLPSGFTLMDGVVNFVRSFPEWERIAIISQDAEMFRTVSTESYTLKTYTVFLTESQAY